MEPSDTGRSYETTSSRSLLYHVIIQPPFPTPRHTSAPLSPCPKSSETNADSSQGYHQASYPTSRTTRWCQAYLWSYLRRDPRCPKDLYVTLLASCTPHRSSKLTILVLENVIRDSVTYTEHAKRKTGKYPYLDTV